MFGDPFGVDNETFEKVTVDLSVSLATIISILIEDIDRTLVASAMS